MTRTESPEPAADAVEPTDAEPTDTQSSQTPLWDAMVAEFGDPLTRPATDEAATASTTGEADG